MKTLLGATRPRTLQFLAPPSAPTSAASWSYSRLGASNLPLVLFWKIDISKWRDNFLDFQLNDRKHLDPNPGNEKRQGDWLPGPVPAGDSAFLPGGSRHCCQYLRPLRVLHDGLPGGRWAVCCWGSPSPSCLPAPAQGWQNYVFGLNSLQIKPNSTLVVFTAK
jgi:hypothetical protein